MGKIYGANVSIYLFIYMMFEFYLPMFIRQMLNI